MKVLIYCDKLWVDSIGLDFNNISMRTIEHLFVELSYCDVDSYWQRRSYDSYGNQVSFRDCTGVWWKRTYDSSGNCLSYSDNTGVNWQKTYD